MIKKEAIAVFFAIFLLGFVTAENITNTSSKDVASKGYACLENRISNKTLSLEEAVFSTLALGPRSDFTKIIEDSKKTNENCWPKNGCKLKETSLVLMAKKRANADTTEIEKWLLSRTKRPTDFLWYIQIDIIKKKKAECIITSGGEQRKININEDMKIEGSAGSCLSISENGYWLKIKDSCLEKDFQISCDEDFITSILFKKRSDSTIFVPSSSQSSSSLGTLTESIKTRCFSSSDGKCDYEGSLWATLALYQAGKDISEYVSYLVADAEDNKKYFPSAFIYITLGGEDYYNEIIQLQKKSQYWEIVSGPYGRFFDTALAMLALSGSSSTELENAKIYLESVQDKDGCWNNKNIRDTAFLLYAGWKRGEPSGSGSTSIKSCESSSYFCERRTDCLDASGEIKTEYACNTIGLVCCTVDVIEKTCRDLGGIICPTEKKCNIAVRSSSDGSCCLGECIDTTFQESCSIYGGVCRYSCDKEEEESSSGTCSNNNICCIKSVTTKKSSFYWLWLIILALLILIIILGIIYRDRLRLWWYSFRGKMKTTPITKSGPGYPGYRPPVQATRPPFARPVSTGTMPPRQVPPPKRPISEKEREIEETLKKLREMSK